MSQSHNDADREPRIRDQKNHEHPLKMSMADRDRDSASKLDLELDYIQERTNLRVSAEIRNFGELAKEPESVVLNQRGQQGKHESQRGS